MFRPKHLIVSLACGCIVPSVDAMNLRMEASTTWAENISRSSAASDWRDAHKFELRTALSHLREWHTGFITSGELGAAFERVPRYTNVDAFNAGAALQVRQKFGFGAFAPVLSFDAGWRHRAARLAGDDGWTATAGLRFSQRLTPSWRLATASDWQQHYARRPYFDTKHHRAFASVTWDFSDRWSLSHGNGRLWGSFTANASPAVWPLALSGALGSHISNYYNSINWAVTHAYGRNWVTYLVDGHVSFWWLELSPAIGRNTALPLRYESLFSVNKVGVKYRQDLWSLQVLHRF